MAQTVDEVTELMNSEIDRPKQKLSLPNWAKYSFTALVVLLLLTMTMMLPNQAFAEKLNVRQIFGANRYETAVEISKDLYEKADTVIIASGENFPDALAGGSLAVQIDSPEIISGMQ